ncbi:DUF2794 domain-containing protein [Kaistia terrae]|nr:DUF2794 domain-containing protein [Kaistia terrae]MCX5581104.1 DUF2794 domain-containing protein [Kaistia terrae]
MSLNPPETAKSVPLIAFNRLELNEILRVYGRMVAAGEWRDYAIDHLRDKAVFSIFRRSSEMPLYTVVKDPELRNRQGAYAVIATGGYIMKRGHDLRQVLAVLDTKLKLVQG